MTRDNHAGMIEAMAGPLRGMSYDAAAEVLGVSASSLATWVHRPLRDRYKPCAPSTAVRREHGRREHGRRPVFVPMHR